MKVPFAGCIFKEYPTGSITQYFGENPTLYARFDLKGHNGIDLVAPHGTRMDAVEDGEIVDVNDNPAGFGKNVKLLAGKNLWVYGHCDTIIVKVGDTVKAGDQIATMGNTGFVVSNSNGNGFWKFNPHAGTHLHLGLRKAKRDPKGFAYPGSTTMITVLDYGNGYKGSIDCLPYFKAENDPKIANLQAQVTLLQKVVELYKQLRGIK